MTFYIYYDKQPLKFLKNQEKHIAKRIIDKIDEVLAINPVSHNAMSIAGEQGIFRMRTGDYRALYRIDYQHKKVVIIKLDKRERVYR
jgi:mRNA-degrading endonuclease RelE of RelBE toxin-antitoxin system